MQTIAKGSGELKKTIAELGHVIDGYAAIATASLGRQPPAQPTLQQVAPKAVPQLVGKARVPVLSVQLDVRPDRDYGELPHVAKVQPQIGLVGGVNVPKKIVVEDSFGQVWPSSPLSAACALWPACASPVARTVAFKRGIQAPPTAPAPCSGTHSWSRATTTCGRTP